MAKRPVDSFEHFEKALHAKMQAFERDLLKEELERADVDAPAVVVAGATFRRVLRAEQTYMTAAGPVTLTRTLFKDYSDPDSRAVAPLEARVGMIAGFWTPTAAKQAAWLVAHLSPRKAEETFERVGHMAPSRSSVERLTKALAQEWEPQRKAFDQALREATVIPEGTVSLAISLDGVMAPLNDTDPVATRAQAAARGQIAKGPAGYREVGCATVSFCDAEGKMLSAIRMARMPEAGKVELKTSLTAEVLALLAKQPSLQVVKVADAGGDNWAYLAELVLDGEEVVDFFHAAEHLNSALASVYGDGKAKTREKFATLRHVLLEQEGGVERVIRALGALRKKEPDNETLKRELGYFRNHRARMEYARVSAAGLPMGSGVVEAACKTLVTQRMKNSGMRWSQEGGQAILNLRGWVQSERFEQAWALLAASSRHEVTLLNHVVALPGTR